MKKELLLKKISELKNKIVVELNKIKKMSNKEKYDYLLYLLSDNKNQKKTKKEDVVFENQIRDTAPEVIELINRFKMDLGLENNSIENINLTKKDLYTEFLEYINEYHDNGKVPKEVQTLSALGISKDKRQELLKRALEENIVYKINRTTYGLIRYREV